MQRLDKRVFLNGAAAADVDDDGRGLHSAQLAFCDHRARFLREGNGDDDDVCLRQEVEQLAGADHGVHAWRVDRGVTSNPQDAHVEGRRDLSGSLADGADADQEHRLAGQLK